MACRCATRLFRNFVEPNQCFLEKLSRITTLMLIYSCLCAVTASILVPLPLPLSLLPASATLPRCCVPASLAIALLLFLSLSDLLYLLRVHGLPIVLQHLSVLLRFVSIFRIGNEVKYLRTSCTAPPATCAGGGGGAGRSANRVTCSPGHAYLLISHSDSSQSNCPAECVTVSLFLSLYNSLHIPYNSLHIYAIGHSNNIIIVSQIISIIIQ